ncbi:MAG: transglutaminase-like domain-containing protein, partial [Sphingomonas sp.]|nr:transglutaminase-like domain-containing protein [Sphingomonas sp.]
IINGAIERFPAALFLRATALTAADPPIADFARQAADAASMLDRLHALNRAVHRRFPLLKRRTSPNHPAAETFAEGRGSARDLAHLFIAAARSIGAPARYVSGYSLIVANGATQPTPHGWAEAYVEGLGWIGFDPSMGLCAAEEYVRVAVGLDAAGAAAVAGSRLGEGREQLDVDIHVEQVAGEE